MTKKVLIEKVDEGKKKLAEEKLVLENPILQWIKAEKAEVNENKLKKEVFIELSKDDVNFINPGSVSFPCPSCGKSMIMRSFKERRLATQYKCEKCEFVGPN